MSEKEVQEIKEPKPMQIDLIDLQTASITQSTTEGYIKSEWTVQKNITNEKLFELPKNFNETEIFKIMEFARKFELIAFNTFS